MTTMCPDFTLDVDGFIEMRPQSPHRAAAQALARAAAEASHNARVYSLLARQAAAIDLEAEFAAMADIADEWAEATGGAAAQSWPTE